MRRLLPWSFLAVLAAAALAADGSPLARRYRAGEIFSYRIEETGTDDGGSGSGYSSRARAEVRRNDDGTFDEAIAWTEASLNGVPVALPAEVLAYRQPLSLDPRVKLGLPDMALLGGRLGGPTDLLNFYVDDALAIKNPGLRAAGDKGRFVYGRPASWADGRRVLVGYDCIDFELTLLALDADTATLRVDHVPPPRACGSVPAPWMRTPVADTANNWFQVEKSSTGYEAGYAKEFFRVELTIRRSDGAILSATMVNPVVGRLRDCRDAALRDCGPERPYRIERRVTLKRES